jgi:cholera toxin transcriptional activator
MEQYSSEALYRFGIFEADKRTGELRKQGRRLALQDQPLQVLLMLLERPGELVTRTEMQQRIWPDGTFVDFEHGLNSAVNKIRDALGDSAANPRFIETLAKRGYRFIAAVETTNAAKVADARQPGRVAEPVGSVAPAKPGKHHFLTTADDLPKVPEVIARSLFLVLQLMYLCFYVVGLARLKDAQEIVSRFVPGHFWVIVLLITAAAGIPTRLYLLSGIAFRSASLRSNFLRLFPMIFPFDELWALAPFLLIDRIGFGLALGATAALLYAPFAQRSLVLMASACQVAPPPATG